MPLKTKERRTHIFLFLLCVANRFLKKKNVSETYKKIYAWHVNFIRGKAYLSLKEGLKGQAAGSLSLSVVRPVRKVEPGEEARAAK